jgi:hypothetical protein
MAKVNSAELWVRLGSAYQQQVAERAEGDREADRKERDPKAHGEDYDHEDLGHGRSQLNSREQERAHEGLVYGSRSRKIGESHQQTAPSRPRDDKKSAPRISSEPPSRTFENCFIPFECSENIQM